MLDSQLFGYRRGAFTGAQEAFQGVIRAAAGGTLFLDEIGEMPLDVQPKLLRFLESGEIHPLGEPSPIPVDVRVVAATNANLEQLVADGRFREDLFYRLNVVRLQVPPLRERREEIPPLVAALSRQVQPRIAEDRHPPRRRDDGVPRALSTGRATSASWPTRSGAWSRSPNLARCSCPNTCRTNSPPAAAPCPPSMRDVAPTEFVVRMDQPMSAAMEHLERTMVQHALKVAGGRFEDAAQLLGLSRKGLYLKRQRLGIADGAPAEPTVTASS